MSRCEAFSGSILRSARYAFELEHLLEIVCFLIGAEPIRAIGLFGLRLAFAPWSEMMIVKLCNSNQIRQHCNDIPVEV